METLEHYFEALSSAAPTPGGGSAATIVGTAAAALVAMVARITIENPRYATVANEAKGLASEADALRARYLAARALDERAYGAVVLAQKLPRTTDDEKIVRTSTLQAALTGAAEAPLAAAGLAVEALRLVVRAEELDNAHLASDVACAAVFARAALEASAANVRVNHSYMKDATAVAEQASALRELEGTGAELYARANGRSRP